MQSRPLPPEITALILQIDSLIKHPEVNYELVTDVRNVNLKALMAIHQLGDEHYSLAKWIYLAGRQDVLDWIYQHTDQHPNNNFFLLHWAVMCRQPEATITAQVKFKRVNPYRNGPPVEPTYTVRYGNDTPLHLAIHENNLEIADQILTASKDPDAAREYSESPLHLAVVTNNLDMVSLLIRHHVSLDVIGPNRLTPLHLAISEERPDIIETLIAAGASVNVQDCNGNTPLHFALLKGDDAEAYFSLLKHRGTEGIFTPNIVNETPFTLAAGNGSAELITRWLDSIPAVETVVSQNIRRALHHAAQHGHTMVVNALLQHLDKNEIRQECSDSPGSALTIAALHHQKGVVKNLCRYLIASYIVQREQEEEYLKHTYFFVKKGAGYSLRQKVDAAIALLAVVNGAANKDTLIPHRGALTTKRLNKIYKIVSKHTACSTDEFHLCTHANAAYRASPLPN